MNIAEFKKEIWKFYKANKRNMPWRDNPTPYYVVVSEIMLQQTQVSRVIPKFTSFIKKFPNWKTLAQAELKNVLLEWQGLGYNRRGKALHEIAKRVVSEWCGKLPNDSAILGTFPHIGPNTAGSIRAFAFNEPTIFIETNIRTVFIHFFFKGKKKVHDEAILKYVEASLFRKNPREWYYALMDYGAMLKAQGKTKNERSAHYKKQTSFKGSNRELRSHILKNLLKKPATPTTLEKELLKPKETILKNLEAMHKEGLLTHNKNLWSVA